jgi:hypothetical protein
MKSKFFNAARAALGLLFASVTMVLLVTASSCQKKEAIFETPENNFAKVADLLEGEIISHSIMSMQDEEGLAIVYGEKDKEDIIALQKITSGTLVSPGDLQNAKLIYSKSGVAVMDVTTNKIWLYPINNTESRKKFDSVMPYLSENYVLAEIAGTIRIGPSFPFFFALSLSDK